ncbi:hypothetical protein C5167_033837 [Papaver somniferum]|uniref:Uncharacterized protein n=1 Tax=Papaver somniferum TaxID=3469 RepID=A0A4Y7KET9_PAPSO|nr:hypothetical protein C5167_033837 [Papaver somniferum]
MVFVYYTKPRNLRINNFSSYSTYKQHCSSDSLASGSVLSILPVSLIKSRESLCSQPHIDTSLQVQ